ncbi:hypothetical protein M569_03035 [Genlisea aurea]|uniref:C2H2-type domain-containing protein n=1 Tax=Genlisea aurea TaxID=192259 RepID=S8EGC5_9LAMI|nr:hypothetical protein M569_03035 [Genlisea aurea]
MDPQIADSLLDRRHMSSNSRTLPVKWFKEWVPQDLVSTGGKCLVLKWVNEATLNAIKERSREPQGGEHDAEPEPTTEILFLCSYEGCGKTFIDAGALRKHSHIHGERQYTCHYENCGKKFLDSSKLKRHYLIHTGERDYVCPHEGCGKAFSLDFNLRSHMKTHSQENYHVCPYPDCGKRYAHEYKLKNHIGSHHEKTMLLLDATPKYSSAPVERPAKSTKSNTGVCGPASAERPYGCPYEGCEKAYIHEYKLNLHLRREHPGHFPEDNHHHQSKNGNEDGSDHDVAGYTPAKRKTPKSRAKPNLKLPPSKVPLQSKSSASRNGGTAAHSTNVSKKAAATMAMTAAAQEDEEEDSEETEEENENNGGGGGDGWRYVNDDEETEYED